MAEDSTPGQGPGKDLMEQVTQVITAYLSHNTVAPAEVRGVVRDIFEQYAEMANPKPAQEVETTRPVPAVPVRRSITPDYLICLEDGSKRAALTRYLRSRYDMTPDEYRRKWGLPADYPMTAPNVQARNSARAKQHGFGRHRDTDDRDQQPAPAEAVEPVAAPPEPSAPAAPKRRGRAAQASESEATAPTSRRGAVPAAPPTRRGRGRGASPASAE